jgi:hypothetical protein
MTHQLDSLGGGKPGNFFTLVRGAIVDWYPYPLVDGARTATAASHPAAAALLVAFVAGAAGFLSPGNRRVERGAALSPSARPS